MKLQFFKRTIGFKIDDFVFWPPHLAIIVALFAPLRGPNTKIWLAKYNFCIVLFTHPLRQSICEVTVLQTHKWLQNWRFCIFCPLFSHIFPILHVIMAWNCHFLPNFLADFNFSDNLLQDRDGVVNLVIILWWLIGAYWKKNAKIVQNHSKWRHYDVIMAWILTLCKNW